MATFKDFARMCKHYRISSKSCEECPIYCDSKNKLFVTCTKYIYLYPERCNSLIDDWVAENPVITYMDDFFAKLPDAKTVPSDAPGVDIPIPAGCVFDFYKDAGLKPCFCNNCYSCWSNEMIKEKE